MKKNHIQKDKINPNAIENQLTNTSSATILASPSPTDKADHSEM